MLPDDTRKRNDSQEMEVKNTYTRKNIDVQMDQLLMQGNKEDAFLKGSEIKAGGEVDFDPRTKRLILISCLAALCVGNMMLDACYAFIPLYVIETNEGINEKGEEVPKWSDEAEISKF